MQKTNLVPAIEERTVSGSSVSFNSAFALPLKACKVSFMATESGSGTKSPSNPYTISGVSNLNLSVNSVSVSVNFGGERFGGELDLLTGILTVTYGKVVYDGSSDEGWGDYSAYNGFRINNYSMKIGISQTGVANWLDIVNARSEFGLVLGANNNSIFASQITNNIAGITDLESWKTFLSTHNLEIVYPLAEPTIIQLSANELSSIIGNNTFSTDTGTLEITFADLQEKSASGSVATFNTALAMPLVECKTEFMCTQEAGTPSPSNPMPTTGVADITLTVNGNSVVIDLNGTRYGGYVDVVNGKCNLTWYGKKLSDLSWTRITSGVEYPYFRADFSDYKYVSNNSNIMCEVYKFIGSIGATGSTEGLNATSDGRLRIRDNSYSDKDTWLADVGNYIIAYELSTPIEISLSDIPTLSTIIGNNSFASDSGSIDLTYKDLDIAKRGNFREVFKLPS